jgi:Spy/CpxP family protein refolding chaperone
MSGAAAIEAQAAAHPGVNRWRDRSVTFLSAQRSDSFLPGGTNMKSILSLSIASVLALSASTFAVAQQTAPAPATPPATSATTTTTTTTTQATPAQRKAAKKQIEADEKAAMAECKKLKGDERKACRQQAEAKEKAATADLRAKK